MYLQYCLLQTFNDISLRRNVFIIRFIFIDVQTLLLTANMDTFCNASGKRSQQHHINFITYTNVNSFQNSFYLFRGSRRAGTFEKDGVRQGKGRGKEWEG